MSTNATGRRCLNGSSRAAVSARSTVRHTAWRSRSILTPRASGSAVEPVNGRVLKSVDEIPAVCLEEDLIAIFRLSPREMRLWRKFPAFIPFPPLPMFDRQIRVSGCVVAWFLPQGSGEYRRSLKAPLHELAG